MSGSPKVSGDAAASASIQYWVGSPAAQALIRITSEAGNLVREFSGAAEKGLQMVEWDLSRDGAGPSAPGGMNRAPRVGPGTYAISVTVGNASAETRLVVNR